WLTFKSVGWYEKFRLLFALSSKRALTMAAFGWSASDIVRAIEFVVEVGKALKETGGASSNYQQTVDFLFVVECTLQNLRMLASSTIDNNKSADLIELQSRQVQKSLDTFMDSVEKF